jgi:Bacterial regulatory proteins, luxR family
VSPCWNGPVPGPAVLSPREKEIVKLVCDGLSSKEISVYLNITIKTVDTHRHNITDKLFGPGFFKGNLALLARWAMTYGIVEPFETEIGSPS